MSGLARGFIVVFAKTWRRLSTLQGLPTAWRLVLSINALKRGRVRFGVVFAVFCRVLPCVLSIFAIIPPPIF